MKSQGIHIDRFMFFDVHIDEMCRKGLYTYLFKSNKRLFRNAYSINFSSIACTHSLIIAQDFGVQQIKGTWMAKNRT